MISALGIKRHRYKIRAFSGRCCVLCDGAEWRPAFQRVTAAVRSVVGTGQGEAVMSGPIYGV